MAVLFTSLWLLQRMSSPLARIRFLFEAPMNPHNPRNHATQGSRHPTGWAQPPPPPGPPPCSNWRHVPPPPPPGPPPDPHTYTTINIPLELHLKARPRGCDGEYIWHLNYGLLDRHDRRRPPSNAQLEILRLGYALFNYNVKNLTVHYWLASLVLMKQSARLWRALQWQDWSHLAAVCRQFRRTRLVAMITGATPASNRYWNRLELMNQCRASCTVLERIMWYHDVRLSGDCSAVLRRVGERQDIAYHDARLAMFYPLP